MNPIHFNHPSNFPHTQTPAIDSQSPSTPFNLMPYYPQSLQSTDTSHSEESAFSRTVRELEEEFYKTFPAARQTSGHNIWMLLQNQGNPQGTTSHHNTPDSNHYSVANPPCQLADLHYDYDDIDLGETMTPISTQSFGARSTQPQPVGSMGRNAQPTDGLNMISNIQPIQYLPSSLQVIAEPVVPSQSYLNPYQHHYYDEPPSLATYEEPIMDSLTQTHPLNQASHYHYGRRMSVSNAANAYYPLNTPPFYENQYRNQASTYHQYYHDHPLSSYPSAVYDNNLSNPREWVYPHSPSPPDSPFPSKRTAEKKPPLACLFCRGRKIACGPPVEGSTDKTCNQCHRRSLKCEYPAESRRGMRKKGSIPNNLNPDGPKVFLTKVKH